MNKEPGMNKDEIRQALLPDRQVANEIQISQGGAGAGALLPQNAGQAMEIAKMMCMGRVGVPAHCREKPGVCLRIVMDATQFGMNPFHLAGESFVVNDQLAYSAKAIDAMVSLSGVLEGRLELTYKGQGADLECTVTGKVRGSNATHTKTARVKDIKTKNSPLWTTDPQQQLGYYTKRAWCRLYAPDAMMGLIADTDPPIDRGEAQVIDPRPQSDVDRVTAHLGVGTVPSESHGEVIDADYCPETGEAVEPEPDDGETTPEPEAEPQPEPDPQPELETLAIQVQVTSQGAVDWARWYNAMKDALQAADDPSLIIQANEAALENLKDAGHGGWVKQLRDIAAVGRKSR